MANIYPNIDNIFDRIAEIQELIATTSKATGTPGTATDNLPYWLTVVSNIADVLEQYRIVAWDFEIQMLLLRERASIARTNAGSITQINQDCINTMSGFAQRRNLETPTTPNKPLQLVADTLRLVCDGYVEHGTAGQELSGSQYTLTFRYRIFQSQDSVVHE